MEQADIGNGSLLLVYYNFLFCVRVDYVPRYVPPIVQSVVRFLNYCLIRIDGAKSRVEYVLEC